MEVNMLSNAQQFSSPQGDIVEVNQQQPQANAKVEKPQDIPAKTYSDSAIIHGEDKKQKELDREPISASFAQAIKDANIQLAGTQRELNYKIHDTTNKVMVSVVNSDTKEVIREIPAEEHLDAMVKMWELAGLIIDQTL